MSNTVGYQLVTLGADGEPTFDVDGNPVPTGSIITLGVPIWGREIIRPARTGITHSTIGGRDWTYRFSRRITFRLTFRILPNKSQLATFATLDAAVDGDADPFLFYEDIDASPLSGILVKKDSDFNEGPEQPITSGGAVIRSVDYTLYLKQFLTDAEVSA